MYSLWRFNLNLSSKFYVKMYRDFYFWNVCSITKSAQTCCNRCKGLLLYKSFYWRTLEVQRKIHLFSKASHLDMRAMSSMKAGWVVTGMPGIAVHVPAIGSDPWRTLSGPGHCQCSHTDDGGRRKGVGCCCRHIGWLLIESFFGITSSRYIKI